MNKRTILFLLVGCFIYCRGTEPFRPKPGSVPFVVYFASRYRGLCVGTLVARTVVLTAAVCITNPETMLPDQTPINVVTGAAYRHPRRGIRVQVTKILIPNLHKVPKSAKFHVIQKSPAVLILKTIVPDVLAEIPLRAISVDFAGEDVVSLQEECMMPGWHFFYRGDMIYPIRKFLLQKNLRVQFMTVVNKNVWCEALDLKLQKALSNFGYDGYFDSSASLCLIDSDRRAQPCHGMFGAPLVCAGRAVGMMMGPDAQWTNCTGYSVMAHVFSSKYLKNFMTCISSMFQPDIKVDWDAMKNSMYDDMDSSYDYIPNLYDKMDSEGSSSSGSSREEDRPID